MPPLREETAIFPEDLLQGFANGQTSSEGAPARKWWALYTLARQEKSLARDLLRSQIPFYLPQVCKTQFSRGRKRQSFEPVFTGYVFLFGDESDRVRTLATNRVSRVIPVADGPGLCGDLRQLQQLIVAKAPLTVESRLSPGRRVRVKEGAFMGTEGIVISRRSECRLLVVVNFLQQGVSLQIDDYLLEPLD